MLTPQAVSKTAQSVTGTPGKTRRQVNGDLPPCLLAPQGLLLENVVEDLITVLLAGRSAAIHQGEDLVAGAGPEHVTVLELLPGAGTALLRLGGPAQALLHPRSRALAPDL